MRQQIDMELDRVAAVGDIGDVDGDVFAIDQHASAFRRRRVERDLQQIVGGGVGTANDDGLMRVLDVDVFPARNHRQGGLLTEHVRRALVEGVGEVQVDDPVGLGVLVLDAA